MKTLAILIVLGTVLGGVTRARADELAPAPCPPPVQASIRMGLPGATSVSCRVHRTETQFVNGQAIASTIDQVKADVALADGRLATVELTGSGKILSTRYAHSDLIGSTGKGMALLFWACALASVAGSLFVISRRNLIAAVMGMVFAFLGIAAIYMLLYAQFLAVVQMLVYAGAIMVLFVFVVMILNRPEDEPVAPSGRTGQVLGGLAILYLVVRLVMMLVRVEPPSETSLAAPQPPPEQCMSWRDEPGGTRSCARTVRHDWGSVGAVGTDLFNAGLFPFEAISILLLVAVVGAIAIARPLREDNDEPARKRMEGGVA
jgi:NADH-quinone oxidoreductase subunit J